MLRKMMIASAILATSTSIAFADGAPYLGASIGLNNNTFKLKDANSNKTNFNANGVNGGVFGGYGATVSQHVYLGGEGFISGGSLNSSTKNINNGNATAKLQSTYSYGLDFMPGFKMTDATMLYAKAGVVATRFELTENATNAGVNTGSYINNGSSAQTIGGGRLGLGVQTAVNKNVDFRGEFVHTAYNSFSTFGAPFKNSVRPSNNQLNFGLAYKFD